MKKSVTIRITTRRYSSLPLHGYILTRSMLYVVFCVLLFSCTATKHLKDNESFYNGAEIKFDPQGKVGGKKSIRTDLEQLITPKPNTKVLGSRPGVWFYFIAGNDENPKGLKKFIKNKLGQRPVLLRDATPDKTAKLLSGQLHNNGYFKSEVSSSLKTKKKNSKVIYTVLLHPPYHLREINYPSPKDSVYARIIRTLREKSLLKPEQRFDLETLQAEQERIEKEVENFGLYYFDDRYLIYEADSTVGEKQVDLDLKLEPGIPSRARKIFRLNEITIYPNYTLATDTLAQKAMSIDVNSFQYVNNNPNFRPKAITRVINLHKGNIYTREAHDLTLSHLMDLGTFKFVNIKFEEAYKDSTFLNSNIYLTPLKKKSLRAEVQGVSKSNNFVGPGVSLTFTNRNFLRGAELFQIKFNSSYEIQVSRRLGKPLNSFELGLEASLTVPRFISPVKIDYSSKRFLPKTTFKLGSTLQNRVGFFRLNSFNAGYGYIWREAASKSHELLPIDINFVRTDKLSDDFVQLLQRNRFLSNSFENQFILGSRYSYTLNTQLKDDLVRQFEKRKIRTHNFYFNGTVDVAGNLINTIQRQVKKSEGEPLTLFNSPYSQYTRGDIDLRHYWQIDERNKLASRIVLGAGYAYGNSTTMPYIKQFSIGGSNSIRAFPARSVGPGTFNVREQDAQGDVPLFIDQRGDIKMEGNVELRFDIVKAFKGAVFVDAGNIWLWQDDVSRPGGQFKKDSFLNELAVGTGVGFRFDFSFFVLRLDVAFPLRKPFLPENERWVTGDIDLLSPSWRKENLIFNIAIGYPF